MPRKSKSSKTTKLRLKANQNISYKKASLFGLVFAIFGIVIILFAHAAPAGKTPLTFNTGTVGTTGNDRRIFQPVDWLTWCDDCVPPPGYTSPPPYWTTQNPWVTNPTTCMWDTDDYFQYSSAGSLAAGASAGINECSYEYTSGNNPNVSKGSVIHAGFLDIFAPSPNLTISETYSWTGGSYTYNTSPVWNKTRRSYEYRACMFINGVYNGTWAPVPDSNGGYGVPVTITATVSNTPTPTYPTPRSVSNVGGVIQYGWQQYYAAVQSGACPSLGSSFPPPLGTPPPVN